MDELNLKQWAVYFVKNKDLFEKKLQSYEEKENIIEFHFKDKDVFYLISEVLNEEAIIFGKGDGFRVIICKASRVNLQFLIQNWKSFMVSKDLLVIFADIEANRRMIVKPYVHNMITEESVLKSGLESLYDNAF